MESAKGQTREPGPQRHDALLVVIPIYNDWNCASLVLQRLAGVLRGAGVEARFLVVDDGSTLPAPADWLSGHPDVDGVTEILVLRRNLGNQRAIAVALAYVQAQRTEATIVVMDGDGEDDPADVPRLLARFLDEGGNKVVFAERRRRSESAVFVLFYWLYRGAHLVLTGRRVRVGNFSILPRTLLERLVVVPELWTHYAASVVHTKLPWTSIPTRRATRISGRSSMTFVTLVVHGLSAISVYSEIVGVRVLCATVALVGLTLGALSSVVGVRLFTDLAVPGWATFTVGLLLVVLTQAVIISLILILMMLNGRQASTFLPVRDYAYFVARVRRAL